ncbi:MAG TPA: response regulator transcription factor [Chloroflexota bacterium]|nr:response regulator transcription factor [Chloroflexota bacterium]
MAEAEQVLIIDDDADTRDIVRQVLQQEAYTVTECSDGRVAVQTFRDRRPDLVLLDVLMPGLDGINICLAIREESDVPIIFLSAKGQATDKAIGLRIGADDYLSKPFDMDELVARIRALLRRAHRRMPEQVQSNQGPRLEFPGLLIDLTKHDVEISGAVVDLTPIEFKLLVKLASEPNHLFTRDQLMQDVWDYEFLGKTRTVDVHIRRLRKKLEDANGPAQYITTVRGFGYRFTTPPDANQASV